MGGDGARVILVFARVSSWVFGLRKFKPTSATATSGAAPSALRSAELKHSSLRSDSSLAAKRRAEALHVVYFSTMHPSPARELLLCVYSRMIRSHERRALGASLLVL